ncbi:MAG: hypothetical protein WCJ37_01175 [Syntrophus sp. (in: bacteria)]
MGLRAVFAAAMPGMFTAAGEDAVFTPATGAPIDCKIFIDFNVDLQPAGMNSQVWQQGTTIEASLSTETGIGIGREPDRGETFTYDGVVYTVQAILANDGLTVKMVVT